MYILGTPEGPLNVTIISEVGKSALSFSHHPVIGLVNDVTIIPKPGHLPTPDNRQGKQRTSGSDQVIWQGDKLHYWQFMELKSSISFVFFDCHSLKIHPISRYEKHWETKFAIFFSLQNLNWTFFIIAFQLRSKARQSRRRLHWKTRNFEERPMRNVETSETSSRFTWNLANFTWMCQNVPNLLRKRVHGCWTTFHETWPWGLRIILMEITCKVFHWHPTCLDLSYEDFLVTSMFGPSDPSD